MSGDLIDLITPCNIISTVRAEANVLIEQKEYKKAIDKLSNAENVTANLIASYKLEAKAKHFSELLGNALDRIKVDLADCYFKDGNLSKAYKLYQELLKSNNLDPHEIESKLENCRKTILRIADSLIIDVSKTVNINNVEDANASLCHTRNLLLLIDELSAKLLLMPIQAKVDKLLWEKQSNDFYNDCQKLLESKASNRRHIDLLQGAIDVYLHHDKLTEDESKMRAALAAKIIVCEQELKHIENHESQGKIVELLEEVEEQLKQGNFPSAKAGLEQASKLLDNVDQAHITDAMKNYLPAQTEAFKNEKDLFTKLIARSLTNLTSEIEEFNKRLNSEQPNNLAKEIIEKALSAKDPSNTIETLYKTHYFLLIETLTSNFKKFWFKFDKRQNQAFMHDITNLISKNIKIIGWWKWLEDKTKYYSLVSQTNPLSKEPILPIIALINTAFEGYKPQQTALKIKLAIFENNIKPKQVTFMLDNSTPYTPVTPVVRKVKAMLQPGT
jgi:pentatricopeptide repeat protein